MDNKMKLEFLANSENERFARVCASAFASQLDPTIEEIAEIKTAVSEAVTNAIVHGYENNGGTVILEGKIKKNQVFFTIHDDGCGIEDIEKAKEPLYTGKPELERSGMGFSIMECFMDTLSIESKVGAGTTVIMSKVIKK